MNKKITSFLLVFVILFSGCAKTKQIDGRYYKPYGVLNEDTDKNLNLKYRIVTGNVVLLFVFSWTLVIPFYLGGFNMYEPVEKKADVFVDAGEQGSIKPIDSANQHPLN